MSQNPSPTLSKETVEKVSQLARLKLTDQELTEFSRQLSTVLGYFEGIANVDTTGVRPLVTPTEMNQSLRADIASGSKTGDNEKILANAPKKSGHLFKVPPVV